MTEHIVRISKSKYTPYVMLDKRLTENNELSYGARGMMAYLLSKPDNWQVRMADLENEPFVRARLGHTNIIEPARDILAKVCA